MKNTGTTTGVTGITVRITGITAFAEIAEPRDRPTIYGSATEGLAHKLHSRWSQNTLVLLPPRHDAETHGNIGRSWAAVGIVSIARYLAACGFRPKECHEAYVLVQLAHHDLEHDHNLNRRLMGSFLASLHPESAPRKALERVSLHDLMGHRDAGMVLFDAPMFQLVCSQCGRSEAGSDLALHEMGADKVCGLSKVVWAQQESPQACTGEVFGLQELRVGNGVEGWLASTIPGGDPSKPRRLLLCASPQFIRIEVRQGAPFDIGDYLKFQWLRLRADTPIQAGQHVKLGREGEEWSYTLIAVVLGVGVSHETRQRARRRLPQHA